MPSIAQADSIQNARAQHALELLQGGRREEAEMLLRRILEVHPQHFHALHLLGVVALEKRDAGRAAVLLNDAAALQPTVAAVHSNLAVALLSLQRPIEALRSSDSALALEACHIQAWVNRGQALRLLARLDEALLSFDRALSLNPNFADAHAGRGRVLFDLGRYDEALAPFEHAMQLQIGSQFALNDLGRTLLKLRRCDEALAVFDAALRNDPAFVDALNSRGSALRELQRFEAAKASYQEALARDSARHDVRSNLANLFLHLGRAQDALETSDLALAGDPELIEAWSIRAQALHDLGRLHESASAHQRLLELDPEHPLALGKYAYARAAICDWSDRQDLAARLNAGVLAGRRVCTPLIYLGFSDSPAAQLGCARTYLAETLAPPRAFAPTAALAHPRPRIGYLSADFCDHPVAHLIAGVLERHDRATVEIFAISTNPKCHLDSMNTRIRGAVEHYHDLGERSDAEVARLLRELEIDIAVDLGGHTRGGRLGIFAHRSAPVQVSFLGFMGTTGAEFIDYVIGDPVALPRHLQPFFSERIVHLPRCFLPNDDTQPISSRTWSRAQAGLPDAAFVFCAFNAPHKINAAVFGLWCELVQKTPNSVLWLKGGEPVMRDNLRASALLHGLDPARLIFAPREPSLAEHLARYRVADLFLDTTPYGAHSTARDALWAGLPVLTLLGDTFASRVAASLLQHLGLEELIAHDADDYRKRALRFTQFPDKLQAVREKLRARRESTTMFSTVHYCRDLESAFAAMLGGPRDAHPVHTPRHSASDKSGPMNSR